MYACNRPPYYQRCQPRPNCVQNNRAQQQPAIYRNFIVRKQFNYRFTKTIRPPPKIQRAVRPQREREIQKEENDDKEFFSFLVGVGVGAIGVIGALAAGVSWLWSYFTGNNENQKDEVKEIVDKVENKDEGKQLEVDYDSDSKGKKSRKQKDQNAPKRGMTAFLFFVQEKSKQYKVDNPNLAHKEIISKLSTIWKTMTTADKKPFEDKAKADKDRYTKEKAEYLKKNNDGDDKGKKKVKAGDAAPAEKKGK